MNNAVARLFCYKTLIVLNKNSLIKHVPVTVAN